MIVYNSHGHYCFGLMFPEATRISKVNNRIKVIRVARGLSLDELAEKADTTNQQISLLESGKRRLTADWLIRLSKELACHPWELISDDLPFRTHLSSTYGESFNSETAKDYVFSHRPESVDELVAET